MYYVSTYSRKPISDFILHRLSCVVNATWGEKFYVKNYHKSTFLSIKKNENCCEIKKNI